MPDEGFAAIVLAGGAGRRLGGASKPQRPVGGRAMLLRVLDACAAANHRIVVGPFSLAPLVPPGVELTQEQPPGGGPVAGLAAALPRVRPGPRRVAVLSADLPFLTPTVLSGLSAAVAGGDDVAVLVDGAGRRQWLCAVWRLPALRRLLAPLGHAAGVAMRDLVVGAGVREVEWGGGSGPPPWFDCDTDEDIRRAEEWVHADPR